MTDIVLGVSLGIGAFLACWFLWILNRRVEALERMMFHSENASASLAARMAGSRKADQ